MEYPYIDFDLDDLRELEESYIETMDFLWDELPDINWNSRIEIKSYFLDEHNILIDSLKIERLTRLLDCKDLDETFLDVLETFVTYLKIKYEVRNYTSCIIRHNTDGRLYLREHNGIYVMPNKQPIVYSPNIKKCITGTNVPELVQTTH